MRTLRVAASCLLVACGGASITAPGAPGARRMPRAAPDEDAADLEVRDAADTALLSRASPALAEATAAYAAGDLHGAARQLQALVEGQTPASTEEAQVAQLWLAKALVRLGLRVSALSVVDEILQAESRPLWARAVPWLSPIARGLPDDGPVIDRIGRLDAEALAAATAGQSPAVAAHLRFLHARHAFAAGDFEDAVAELRTVPSASPWGNRARFLEAAAHVRVRHARSALGALRAVLASVEARPSAPDAARDRDLAWLSIGRLYYSASGDEGRERLLGDAIAAYDRVSRDGA